ncbi:MAG: hypothetical protein JEZ00_01850 [Anaerolineaceae bacterium]|nr:hypothetical protein [Anaerolineaceae bacterium]
MNQNSNSLFDTINLYPFLRLSITGIVLQLICIVGGAIVIGALGLQPQTALEYFEVMQESKFAGLLVDDFFSIFLVALYLFTFTGLFFVVAKRNFAMAFVSTLLTYIAVILTISAHDGFTLIHLSEQYWATTDNDIKMQLITAGETAISQNMWNSTSAFFSGLFLQGAGVLISIAMLKHTSFSKVTAISGLLANGLDLFQHLMHHMRVELPDGVLYFMGPIYLIWFVSLIIDLLKESKQYKINYQAV